MSSGEQNFNAGVLSQTLVSSPCIKYILPARVRTPLHNDVVMVGQSSVHLRELTSDGTLSNVIAEQELGIQILAAKVVSAEEYVLSVEDAILDNGRDDLRYKIRGDPCDDDQPPQIVVLSIASSELVFMYARNLPNGTAQFVHAKRHIMGGMPWPRKYGTHLAIDSGSRALAVAAARDAFAILALKEVDEIKADIDNWDPRDPLTIVPIKEQRFIQVDGMILRMDFLTSALSDPHRVVLLLIVANQGTTRLLLYRWDSGRPLSTIRPLRCSGQPLPREDSFPRLLIPLSNLTSFAIVAGQKIVFYDDINSKHLRRQEFKVPDTDVSKQWAQWTKPYRHNEHRKKKEDIFLLREDGLLHHTVVSHTMTDFVTLTVAAAQLGVHVDSAVCAVSSPPTVGGDLLIVCGDTTEGGVFNLPARAPFRIMQKIPNWSPITDMLHLYHKNNPSLPRDHGAILATTGMHERRCCLTELKQGLEAQVGWTIAHEDLITVDCLWALGQPAEDRLLLLFSHHEHTSILSYEARQGEFVYIHPTDCPQICFDAPTLTACKLANALILQITTNRITLFDIATEEARSDMEIAGHFAYADADPNGGFFAVITRQAMNTRICSGWVSALAPGDHTIGLSPEPLDLAYVPVGIRVATISGRPICLVGSQEGSVHLYEFDKTGRAITLDTWGLASIDNRLIEQQIATLCILALPSASEGLVLCGLKTGQVLICRLALQPQPREADATFTSIRILSVGSCPVAIRPESEASLESERSAFVLCGDSTSRIRLYRNSQGLDYTVDALLITDRQEPAYLSPPVTAIDRISQFTSDPEWTSTGLLICATGSQLLVLSTGQTGIFPRPMRPIHPTRHLIYSDPLRQCIVASSRPTCPGVNKSSQQSSDRPWLQLIGPTRPTSENVQLSKSRFYFGEHGERVKSLLDWAPTDGRSHFDMIIIGSDRGNDGHVAYMSVSRLAQPKPGQSAKRVAFYPGKPIRALCAYGMSSLVICAGRELKLLHLDMATRGWQHHGELELPSHATEIRVKGSVIYIATAKHSFMLVREENQKLTKIGSDQYAGTARNIMPYGSGSTLVNLISDHGSRILNFTERPIRGSRPSFEANIPLAIDKLANLRLSSTDDQRGRFLGCTIDGTVYLLTTLSEPEMKLLRLLEHLCEPIRQQAIKNAGVLAHAIAHKYASKLESAGITPPSLGATHARGDVLQGLLQPGPYNIRFLLKKRIKVEDPLIKEEDELENLRDLARPVIGPSSDVVDGIVLWLRRLLNVPSF